MKKKDVEVELQYGLTVIAVYSYLTWGIPLEYFNDFLGKFNNKAEQLLFYINFKKMHPKVFKDRGE